MDWTVRIAIAVNIETTVAADDEDIAKAMANLVVTKAIDQAVRGTGSLVWLYPLLSEAKLRR